MTSIKAKIGPQVMAAILPGQIIWDTELKRFGARWGARGSTYFITPRVDGHQRWITLGRHGVLTAAEARAKARHLLAEADFGGDPTRARRAGQSIPNFAEFAAAWLTTHAKAKRKASTHHEYQRIINFYLKPRLGKVRLDRITRSDVLDLHAQLAGTPYQANRAIAVLSSMMSFAEGVGHRAQYSNPCRGVERFKERRRKRPLTMKELAALWAHLTKIEPDTNPYIIGAIRLLLLTGMRREEVLTLKRVYLNAAAGELRLPDTKTGPRTIILSGAASAVIDTLPQLDDNPFVFVGLKRGQRLVNISDTWREIRSTLGFPDVRLHDLRHTVGTLLAQYAPIVVVRDALGHNDVTTTNGYSHTAESDVRLALERLSAILARETPHD